MSVYLDYNATSPLREEGAQEMKSLISVVGNPSSVHSFGRQARKLIEDARSRIATSLEIEAKKIIFTSGATESNNLALKGFMGRVIISGGEHESVFQAREDAVHIPLLENGLIDLEKLEELLKQDGAQSQPTLVSVIAAHNETGVIQPLSDVLYFTKKYKAFLHSDAVQGIGRMKFSWDELDMMSFSGHKVGGPAGVGALMINPNIPLKPLIVGGGQEKSYRSGTENLLGIRGMAAAIEVCVKDDWLKVDSLRIQLEESLLKICPQAKIFGKNVNRLPNTTLISMPGVKSEIQVMNFDLEGFAVSAGSACSSGKVKGSRVLQAMGVKSEDKKNVIRISLGCNTTRDELVKFKEAWKKIFEKFNSVSLKEKNVIKNINNRGMNELLFSA